MDAETIGVICRHFKLSQISACVDGPIGTAGKSGVLDSAQGRFFVRCRSAEHSAPEHIAFEHDLLRTVQEAGFPVVAPVADGEGRTWLSTPDGIVELFPWIVGGPFEPGNAAQIEEIARQLAAFHRITEGISRHKDQPREDEPSRLIRELELFTAGADLAGYEPLLAELKKTLKALTEEFAGRVTGGLPQAIVHGDLHPGNVKFRGARLAGLFDFDWANRQERVKDVCDGLMFFTARERRPASSDIWSLTSEVTIHPDLAALFLSGYQAARSLTAEEMAALPVLMSARWLQMRIRGMRKVPLEQRLKFLDRGNLLHVLDRVKKYRLPSACISGAGCY